MTATTADDRDVGLNETAAMTGGADGTNYRGDDRGTDGDRLGQSGRKRLRVQDS